MAGDAMAQAAGYSALGSAFDVVGNYFNGSVNTGFNKKLMEYQYQLNQMGINEMNRYNSPLAQMDRLSAAGLNPNLVYKSGSVDGNQSSAASSGLSSAKFTAPPDFMGNYVKSAQLMNETKVADASAQKILADQQLSQARYLDTMIDVARKDETFWTDVEQAKANLRKTNQSIDEGYARQNKIEQESNNLRIMAAKLNEEANYIHYKAENERLYVPQVLKERARNLASSTELNKEQKEVAKTIASLNEKKIEYLDQQIKDLVFVTGSHALDYKLQKMMDEFGATGMKPKDFLDFLMKLLQTALK